MIELDSIRNTIKSDLDLVDGIISKQLGSDIPLIEEIAQYVFQCGGKRLRPILVILGARFFEEASKRYLDLAAVVELIHTATLLHDDVVDGSSIRRGKPTANVNFGNSVSVLVGDFIYSKSFQMMVDVGDLNVLRLLAHAAKIIAEGEVMQLNCAGNPNVSENRYYEVISRKTAALFEAAAQLGAVLTQRSEEEINAMATFGRHVGIAFQLIDDALDYGFSGHDIGKKIGDDLSEGKVTLPLIYILKNGTEKQRQLIKSAIVQRSGEFLTEVQEAISSSNAIQHTILAAKKEVEIAKNALAIFPKTFWYNTMIQFAELVISRTF